MLCFEVAGKQGPGLLLVLPSTLYDPGQVFLLFCVMAHFLALGNEEGCSLLLGIYGRRRYLSVSCGGTQNYRRMQREVLALNSN